MTIRIILGLQPRDKAAMLVVNRPSPHYAPVSKHKEMRPRLGWTISYKSLYFVHPSLDLIPLFTGMRERSIQQNFFPKNLHENRV